MSLALLLAVSISAASVQDRDAADDTVGYSNENYLSLGTLFVDSAYAENGRNAYIKCTRSMFK